MTVVIHMPEPVLGGDEALRKEGIVLRRRANMRNAPRIADHFHRLAQTRGADRRGQVGQRGHEVRPGDGHAGSFEMQQL